MTSSDASEDELLERIAALEEENKRLRAKLRWYEGPHTPPANNNPAVMSRRLRTNHRDIFWKSRNFSAHFFAKLIGAL